MLVAPLLGSSDHTRCQCCIHFQRHNRLFSIDLTLYPCIYYPVGHHYAKLCISSRMSLSDENRAHMRNSSHKPSSTSQSSSIFPLPDAAIFHQPQRTQETKSSGSSIGSKRKREDVDDERSGTSRRLAPLRPSSTSDFSDTLKTQIRVEYDNKCWHCGASPADVCHVIGSRDNTVSRSPYASTYPWTLH